MYLMAITNLDYIWISIFFGSIALIAYKFRRYNQTSEVFLQPQIAQGSLVYLFGTIGIIDIVLAGYLGSKLGLSIFYLAGIATIINEFWLKNKLFNLYKKHNVSNFNAYVELKLGNITGFVVSSVHMLLILGLLILTMFVTAKLFYALTGWNFVNSIVGVTGLTMICAIIGGITALHYNKLIQVMVILISLLITIVLAVSYQGGIQDILTQLGHYAILQHKPQTFYTHISLFSAKNIVLLSLLVAIFFGINLLDMHLGGQCNDNKPLLKVLFTLVILFMLVAPGVLAISAKTPSKGVNGTNIVTIQTQFPDGQTGYIVRAVNNDSQQPIITPGIIPARIDDTSNTIIHKGYDYFLATIVVLRHYLPTSLQFLLILVVFSGFVLAIATYLATLCRIVLSNMIVPTGFIDKYGDIGKLWTIRLSILGFSAIALIVANFIPHGFNFLHGVSWILATLIAPLLGMLLLAMVVHKRCSGYIGLIIGIIVSTIMIFKFNMPDQLNKYAIISLISCCVTLAAGYITCFLNI